MQSNRTGNSKGLMFSGGEMAIEFHLNQISFMAGDYVSGAVLINQFMPFRASQLTLTFEGFEKIKFLAQEDINKPVSAPGTHHVPCQGKYRIVTYSVTLAKFESGVHEPGQYKYPFVIKLPDWLPASFLLSDYEPEKGRKVMKIKYRMLAKMAPSDKTDSSAGAFLPQFKAKRLIVIQTIGDRDKTVDYLTNKDKFRYNFNYSKRSGKQLLLQGPTAHVNMSVDKQFYYCGETVKAWVNLDNLRSQVGVESYEFELVRRIQGAGLNKFLMGKAGGNKVYDFVEVHSVMKKEHPSKCTSEMVEGVEVELELPTIDENSWSPMPFDQHIDEEQLCSTFSPSFNGKIFKVFYELVLRVKY